MADKDRIAELRKKFASGGKLTDQDLFDLAKVDGPDSFYAKELAQREPGPAGTAATHFRESSAEEGGGKGSEQSHKPPVSRAPQTWREFDLATQGGETTRKKDDGDTKKVPTGDTKKVPTGDKDNDDAKKLLEAQKGKSKGGGGKSAVSTPLSTASHRAERPLDTYLRSDKDAHERERRAAIGGVGYSPIQRQFRDARLKSNMKELRGLVGFRREEAARKAADLEARGPASGVDPETGKRIPGELLGRVIVGPDGGQAGFMTTKSGREALRVNPGTAFGRGRVRGGVINKSTFPETWEDIDERKETATRMASKNEQFMDLFGRAKAGSLTRDEKTKAGGFGAGFSGKGFSGKGYGDPPEEPDAPDPMVDRQQQVKPGRIKVPTKPTGSITPPVSHASASGTDTGPGPRRERIAGGLPGKTKTATDLLKKNKKKRPRKFDPDKDFIPEPGNWDPDFGPPGRIKSRTY